eukprot:gene25882-biopygen17865
MSRGGCSRPQ